MLWLHLGIATVASTNLTIRKRVLGHPRAEEVARMQIREVKWPCFARISWSSRQGLASML